MTASVVKHKRGTSTQWASATYVLKDGEIGIDKTLNKIKVGNGSSLWSALPFINVLPSELTELAQDAVELAITAGTGITKTYNDTANTITLAVDNTIANKTYVDTAVSGLQSASIQTYIPLSLLGQVDGVAELDSDGVIPDSQIPAGITRDTELSSAVSTAINNLIEGAPAALNTLNELAAAINDDASYAATVTEVLGTKASLTGSETLSNKTLFRPTITTAGNTTTQTLSTLIVSKFLGATASIVVEAASPIASAIAGDTIVFSDVPSLSSYTYVVGSKLIFGGNASINFSNSQYQSGAQAPMFAWASDGATNFTTATVFSSQEDVTISSTEIGYLDGVTSAIQTQLDGKVDESIITAKGDLYVGSASSALDNLAVGTNGYLLTADSNETLGVKWAAAPVSLPSQSGESGKYLKTNGTSASWSALDVEGPNLMNIMEAW